MKEKENFDSVSHEDGWTTKTLPEQHRKLLKRIKAITSEEIHKIGIKIGVYTEDGRLRKKYGGEAD